jgi:unspecific monooxygenase
MAKLPNPIKTPPILQKIHWIADPVGYMETHTKTYPDIFSAEIVGFGDGLVFVDHPGAIQKILTNDQRKIFSAPGELNEIIAPLIGDQSLIMLSGDRHRRRRQLLMPPFHGDRMRSYGDLIVKLTEEAFNNLPVNQVFTARTVTQEISLQVILQAVFGLYEAQSCQSLKHRLSLMSDLFRSALTSAFLFFPFLQKDLGSWSPWGNFLRQREAIDQLLYQEIAQRRSHPNPDSIDILSMLMSATDEEGNPMTDKELRDELMTLLFAGHETTATAMAWALYWIHRLPEVKAKLLDELASLGSNPDLMSIIRSPYLTAVCNETLRIHPVAMLTFPRVVEEPVELLGHLLPKGTTVAGCIYLTHQREELYPEPKKFIPERFLERNYSPYEFMPFGGGVRRCIGEALAMFEMKLVLATILRKYDLALADSRPEKPRRRGVTLAAENGVRMIIKGRKGISKKELQSVVS